VITAFNFTNVIDFVKCSPDVDHTPSEAVASPIIPTSSDGLSQAIDDNSTAPNADPTPRSTPYTGGVDMIDNSTDATVATADSGDSIRAF
jgi:hypothetical protein